MKAASSANKDVTDTEVVDRSVRGSGPGFVRDNVVSKIPLIGRGGVAGLAVMNQTVWVVHYGQSYLHVYPVTSPHQPQRFPIKGLSQPANMVRFPPGQSQLVISDYDNKQLLWIQLEQRNAVWKLISQRSVKVKYGQLGLGVRDNQLLVCDNDDDFIHVLSTSFK